MSVWDSLFGGGLNQVGTQTLTGNTQTGMPDWLQGPMQNSVSQAGQNLNNPMFAPFSQDTQQGMNSISGMAQNPGTIPGYGSAFDQYQQTLNGDYLAGGQGFDAAQQAAANRIIPQVTSAFNKSGRMGGSAGQSELTRQLGDSFAGLYDNERGRQMNALNMAPQMQNLAFDPANRQLGIGAMQEEKTLEQQNDPSNRLARYQGEIGNVAPNFRSTTTQEDAPIYGNDPDRVGQALGGAGLLGTLLGTDMNGDDNPGGTIGGWLGDALGLGGGGGAAAGGSGGIPDWFDTIFGGDVSSNVGDLFASGDIMTGGLNDGGGATNALGGGLGAGSASPSGAAGSGVGGLPSLPPGVTDAVQGLFGGGGSAFPTAANGGLTLSTAPGASLPLAGAELGAGAATGLTGAGGVPLWGAGTAVGPGGALGGVAGAALGAAAPLALAAYSQQKFAADKAAHQQAMNPAINQAFSEPAQQHGDVYGRKFTHLGQEYIYTGTSAPGPWSPTNSQGLANSMSPDDQASFEASRGTGTAMTGVYNPRTGEYGTATPEGFIANSDIFDASQDQSNAGGAG